MEKLNTVAFLPLRGGSKSIPLKNIKLLGGRPLAYWVLSAAQECKNIQKIFVSTDSEKIKQVILDLGLSKVQVIDRSQKTATDEATSELALLEFADNYDFEKVVFLQATSPLLKSEDIKAALAKMDKEDSDSLLSVVRQKRFFWQESDKGAKALNYHFNERPRRQDFKGTLVENGAFYITHKKGLLNSQCRLNGKISLWEMPEETYFEIDEPSDWKIMESLIEEHQVSSLKERLKSIKLVLSDVDGVLTDAGMYYSESGDELKKFNTRDGKGFSLLKAQGLIVGIVTGEESKMVEKRADKLNISILKQGIKNKLPVVQNIAKEQGISLDEVLFIGDDINDLEVLQSVGFACCPQDAQPENKSVSDYICAKNGGEGCFREVADMILRFRL